MSSVRPTKSPKLPTLPRISDSGGSPQASSGIAGAGAARTATPAPARRSNSGFSTSSAGAATPLQAIVTPAAPVEREVTFVYDAGDHRLENLQLNGSWNQETGRFDSEWGQPIPMRPLGGGKWAATVKLLDDGEPHDWQWGVLADGAQGKGTWAVMSEGNLRFELSAATREVGYSPTTYHAMGAHRSGDDLAFRVWLPNAKSVQVKLFEPSGEVRRVPMQRGADGKWEATLAGGFAGAVGKSYVYEVLDSQGRTVDRPDPYAREMTGEQRGVSRFYLDPAKAREANPFTPGRVELMRFELPDDGGGLERAYLVLKDEHGRPLDREALRARLGAFDAELVGKVRGPLGNDLWSEHVEADGRIPLVSRGGTWSALVNNPEALMGLRYELQAWQRGPDGSLVLRGDADRDSRLDDLERRTSVVNDPWSDQLTHDSGKSFRASVVADPSFPWKHDAAPRERDHSKWVVAQVHVGSLFGKAGNANRSTFEDVLSRLDYFVAQQKELGLKVNTLELLPVNEVEGTRDWGYMGANSLAIESSLGFEENGHWVSGTQALKRLVDAAHERGLNVVNDVVYNHIGGDYDHLQNIDGPENPYYDWSDEPGVQARTTPWGPQPAYPREQVKQFLVDHAVAQLEELHFDGLRFDFTGPIIETKEGWNLLREMNRALHYLRPDFFTVAEQFDYNPDISEPAGPRGQGGAGFDAQWYTEYQHRLVHDGGNPGLLQAAAKGQRTDVDAFMSMLTNPRGLRDWRKAYAVISNHDEVGNAQRTITTAQGNEPRALPVQWARDATRFVAGIGLTSPGMPMFFQGEESAAQNGFSWGIPSTWDLGWEWFKLGADWDWEHLVFNDAQKAEYERLFALPPAARESDPFLRALAPADRQVFEHLAALEPAAREKTMLDITRRQAFQFFRDALDLRQATPALDAGSPVSRVYTHNDDSVLAFARGTGDGQCLVIGSLNRKPLRGYRIPFPPGEWKQVLNSDAARYGGSGVGTASARIPGGGERELDLPAAGVVVFQKVG